MNATPFREVMQNRYAIVTNGRHPQPQLVEFRLLLLQLDQLSFAIRSPIRRPVKQDNGTLGTQDLCQGLELIPLILQLEPRHFSSHGGAVLSPLQTVTNQEK